MVHAPFSRKILRWVLSAAVGVFAATLGFSLVAFAVPPAGPGVGSGAIGTDAANNLSVGTSTTQANTKFLVVASTTGDTGNYVVKVWDKNQNPFFIIRNDGSVAIGTNTFTGGAILTVNGTVAATTLSGSWTGTLGAANVSAGAFGSNTGNGNYSFPGSLGIASGLTVTAGAVSLPATSIANAALQGSGSHTVTAGTGLSGGGAVALGGSVTLSMPSVGTPGTYGSATQVPVLTTDAQGRVTGVTNTAITAGGSGTVTSITAGAGLSGGVITSTGTISLNLGNANTWTVAQTFNGGLTATTFSGAGTGLTGTAASLTAGNANQLIGKNWYWSGQAGQPTWLWGGTDGTNMYVYNPSNFSVSYAATAGTAGNITAYTINQSVGTANSPTFQETYTNGWFRSQTAGTGWYSTSYGVGVYATQAGRVDLYNGAGLYVPGASLLAGNVTIGAAGAGKLTVGTIDPAYTINGEKFATYVPGMVGQKEETTGVASLTQTSNGTWQSVVDFNSLLKGSDLWLFAQATNLKKQIGSMTVLLTPGFDGNVWYHVDPAAMTLTISGKPTGDTHDLSVSYRLTAPRFDSTSWPNTRTDDAAGLIINN